MGRDSHIMKWPEMARPVFRKLFWGEISLLPAPDPRSRLQGRKIEPHGAVSME